LRAPECTLEGEVDPQPAFARSASYGGFESAEAREREGGSGSGGGCLNFFCSRLSVYLFLAADPPP